MPTPPRIGILGLGFMGRTHLASFRALQKEGLATVTAALDPAGGSANGGNLATTGGEAPDLTGITLYQNVDRFFEEAPVDAVSICTPTDTHVALARRALERGLHVLCEKPVALHPAEIRGLADVAKASGRVCMPAMVMRFWPGWAWLRDRIHDRRFGALKTLTLERLGSLPRWNQAFYADDARSGGALVDLHIHDTDFVYWCFGRPIAVSSAGSSQQVTTLYRVLAPDGGQSPLVCASGGWAQQATFGFRMRYLANFEHATVEFDLARGEHPVTVADAQGVRTEDVGTMSGYEAEVRHFAALIAKGLSPRCTLEDAAEVAELLLRERESLAGRSA
jgi:predicted dehydrogenase